MSSSFYLPLCIWANGCGRRPSLLSGWPSLLSCLQHCCVSLRMVRAGLLCLSSWRAPREALAPRWSPAKVAQGTPGVTVSPTSCSTQQGKTERERTLMGLALIPLGMLVQDECDIHSLPRPVLGTSSPLSPGTTDIATEPKSTREGQNLHSPCSAPWNKHYKSTASPLCFTWRATALSATDPRSSRALYCKELPDCSVSNETLLLLEQDCASAGNQTLPRSSGTTQAPCSSAPRCSEANKCSDTTCHSRHPQPNYQTPFPAAPSKK